MKLLWGTKEECSRKVEDYKGEGERCGIGERAAGGGEKERIPRIARRSFVAKLLYRPAIITERVVGYSTKDTARF